MTDPLPIARKRLGDAVRGLAEPLPFWDSGRLRYTPALYGRLRGSLRGRITRAGRAVAGSRAPCRVDALALLCEIDSTTATWIGGTGTVDRLRRLAAVAHRPQDCDRLDDCSAQIEAWTLKAAELVGDRPPEIPLRQPCPSCGRTFVYRLSSGENVRQWALKVSETGARCSGCHAHWDLERLPFLATLLQTRNDPPP